MAISVSLNGEIFEQVIYSKEDDFEQLVAENAGTIFGDKAIYINAKQKINTSSLGGTIPDGFLIDLSDTEDPQFYLVEVELQSHDFFGHIFPQITKFFAFYRDSKQRHKLIETMFALFKDDPVLTKKLKDWIETKEMYKFFKDTIDNNQNILIIIDGPKPEFREIMDTYTEWGRMVKVLIVNHFRRDKNEIVTVEPPFQNIAFEDAVSPSPDSEISEPSQYTEESHLEGRSQIVRDIYTQLKSTFLSTSRTVIFKPATRSIRVHTPRNIAQIFFTRSKVWIECRRVPVNEANEILKYHKATHRTSSNRARDYCAVEICDTNHWDEIDRLVARVVEKHREIKL